MNPTMGNSNGQNGMNRNRWGWGPGSPGATNNPSGAGRFSGGNFGLNRQIQGGGPMLQQSNQGGLGGMTGALINRFRQRQMAGNMNRSAGDALMRSPGGPGGITDSTPAATMPPPPPVGQPGQPSQPPIASVGSAGNRPTPPGGGAPPSAGLPPGGPPPPGSNVVAHHEALPDGGAPPISNPTPGAPAPTGNMSGIIQNHGAPAAPSPTAGGNPMPAGFNSASQPIFNLPRVPGGPGGAASPINSMRPGAIAPSGSEDPGQPQPSMLGPYADTPSPGGGPSGPSGGDQSLAPSPAPDGLIPSRDPYANSGGPGGPSGGAITPGQDQRIDQMQPQMFARGGFTKIAKMHPMHSRPMRMHPSQIPMRPPAMGGTPPMGPPAGMPPPPPGMVNPSGPPNLPGAQSPQYASGGIVPSISRMNPMSSSSSQILANPVPMARQMMRYRTQGGPMARLQTPTQSTKYSVDSGKFGSKKFPMPKNEMRSMTSPAYQ